MLDQSPHQLARAEAKPALARAAKVLGDAEDLPFPTDHFDRYVSAGSIEYWPEPQRAIAEAYRVLRPEGRAALIGPVRPGHPLAAPAGGDVDAVPRRGGVPRLVHRRRLRRRRARGARARLVPQPARPVRRRGLRAQAGGRALAAARSGRCATRRAPRPGPPSARASRCASPSDRSRARSSSRSAPRSALRHRLRARSAP